MCVYVYVCVRVVQLYLYGILYTFLLQNKLLVREKIHFYTIPSGKKAGESPANRRRQSDLVAFFYKGLKINLFHVYYIVISAFIQKSALKLCAILVLVACL